MNKADEVGPFRINTKDGTHARLKDFCFLCVCVRVKSKQLEVSYHEIIHCLYSFLLSSLPPPPPPPPSVFK